MEIIVDAIAQSIKAHTLLDPVRQLEEEREQLIQEMEKLEEMVI